MTDLDAIRNALGHLTHGPTPDVAVTLSPTGKSKSQVEDIHARLEATADHYIRQIKGSYWKGLREAEFYRLWAGREFLKAYRLLEEVGGHI